MVRFPPFVYGAPDHRWTGCLVRKPRAGRAAVHLVCLAVLIPATTMADRAVQASAAEAGRTVSSGVEDREKPLIAAAGNEHVAWLIRTQWQPAEQRFLNMFARQETGWTAFKPAEITPEIGRIVRSAASGERLHVFFQDGTHHSYGQRDRRVEISLPGRAVPEALTGAPNHRASRRLYAVVSNAVGRRVRAAYQPPASVPSTLPGTPEATPGISAADGWTGDSNPVDGALFDHASETAATAPAADNRSEPCFELIAYEGLQWRPIVPIPFAASQFDRACWWLCATDNAVYVFWLPGRDRDSPATLAYRRWSEGEWDLSGTIELGARFEYGAALCPARSVVFAAALREPAGSAATRSAPSGGIATTRGSGSESVRWCLWRLVGDHWQASGIAASDRTGDDLTLSPPQTVVTAFGQNVLIATVYEDRTIASGVWPPEGGRPARPLQITTAFDKPPGPLLESDTREWLGLFVVIGIVALVFWRRQESLTASVRIPRDLVLARLWKRAAAACLDIAPALLATAWLWYEPAEAYRRALVAGEWSGPGRAATPDELLTAWLAVRAVYAVYCGLFEWKWSTTPGKRLLGCRLLSESGQTPAVAQVAARNLSRILELETYVPVWPLALVVLLTRNRQRIGDLVARTVVVESAGSQLESHDDEPDEV